MCKVLYSEMFLREIFQLPPIFILCNIWYKLWAGSGLLNYLLTPVIVWSYNEWPRYKRYGLGLLLSNDGLNSCKLKCTREVQWPYQWSVGIECGDTLVLNFFITLYCTDSFVYYNNVYFFILKNVWYSHKNHFHFSRSYYYGRFCRDYCCSSPKMEFLKRLYTIKARLQNAITSALRGSLPPLFSFSSWIMTLVTEIIYKRVLLKTKF